MNTVGAFLRVDAFSIAPLARNRKSPSWRRGSYFRDRGFCAFAALRRGRFMFLEWFSPVFVDFPEQGLIPLLP
jgi:hypothetical protein